MVCSYLLKIWYTKELERFLRSSSCKVRAMRGMKQQIGMN